MAVDFLVRVVVDPSQAVTGSRTVDRELKRVENSADKLRATLARAFAAAGLTIGLTGAVRLLADFSQEMSTVQAVTNATAGEFTALSEEAQRLGATTRFSAIEAAQAMTELARAGFTASESLEAASGTLQLAQAGGIGLARASEIASATLRGFRLEVGELGRVNDVLALAANASNTSVEGLGDALKFVAPVAAGTGVQLEEVTASVAALANAGLDASLAGTGLRRVISELESPSENTRKIFTALGVSAREVQISQVGLTGALQALAQAGIDTGTALEIFGDRGGPAFEVLKGALPFVKQMTDQLSNAQGVAARTAAIMDDNLNGSLLKVRAAAQALVLELGDAGANGVLRKLLDTLSGGLRFATENIEAVTKAVELLSIALAVRLAGQAISAVIQGLNALKVALLTNPLSLLPALIALAVAALITFKDEIADFTVAGHRLGDVLQVAFDIARERFEFLVGRFKEALPIIGHFVSSVIDFFGTAFKVILDGLGQFANLFLPIFGDMLGEGGAVGLVKKFANVTVAIFRTIGDAFTAIIRGILAGFAALGEFDITSPIESIKRVAAKGFKDVGGIIDSTLTAAQKNFSVDYIGAFADLGKAAAASLTNGFRGLSGAEALAEFFDFSGDFNEGLANLEGQRMAESLIEGAKKALEAARGFIAGLFPSATPGATPTAAPAPEPPAPISPRALELLQEINGPQQEFLETQRALGELLDANRISADEYAIALNGAAVAAHTASQSMSDGLAQGLDLVQQRLLDTAATVSQTVVNAFGRAEDAIVQFATTGEVNFSAFVDGLLADVARILAQKALLALLDAFTGGAASAGTSIFGALFGARAEGGHVDANKPYLVGEEGPELYTPEGAGDITPAGETAALMRGGGSPVVNVETKPPVVNILNVSDPSEIPAGIESAEGEAAIMNVITRRRRQVRGAIG